MIKTFFDFILVYLTASFFFNMYLYGVFNSFIPSYIYTFLSVIGFFIYFRNKYLKRLINKRLKEQDKNYIKFRLDIQDKYEEFTSRILRNKERILEHIKNTDLKIESLSNTKVVPNITNYNPIKALDSLKNILKRNTLNEKIIWEKFYDNKEFRKLNLEAVFLNEIKNLESLEKPTFLNFLDEKSNISDEQKKKIIQLENQLSESLVEFHKSATNKINHFLQSYKTKYEIKGKQWLTEENKFKTDQEQFNKSIDLLKKNYYEKNKEAVTKYIDFIINIIQFDQNFIRSIVVDYNPLNGVLIIEYLLPSLENFPKVKEMRYLSTRNEYKEIEYSQREISSLYEDIIYRIVLDIIGITFRVDNANAINTVVFNGWSNAINTATGLYSKACILSIVCEKKEFSQINLSEVNPKDCFKSLKGVSAHKIINLTPIKPIISIDNNDKRFVKSKDIGINSLTNLASMHWEDFEHLIREIFEKEFSLNGGNVKVTRSSRDGGVDAIAYDPDPIRGGKIVIQAKRYTNTVGVSAVRDLYGTVLNEGATKGILVTTSDYGTDSFKFAIDKPITLINGGHLLYLLERHGYNARINIHEAKEELK